MPHGRERDPMATKNKRIRAVGMWANYFKALGESTWEEDCNGEKDDRFSKKTCPGQYGAPF